MHVCGWKTELGRAWPSRNQEKRRGEEELAQLLQSMRFASGDGRKKVPRRKVIEDLNNSPVPTRPWALRFGRAKCGVFLLKQSFSTI